MAERSLELDSIELAAAIFGSGDQNIHLLEKEFRVTAVCRGSVLRFTGEQKDVDAAARAVAAAAGRAGRAGPALTRVPRRPWPVTILEETSRTVMMASIFCWTGLL